MRNRYLWTSKDGGELYDSALDKHVLLVGMDEQIKGEPDFLRHIISLLNKHPYVVPMNNEEWLRQHPHCPLDKTGKLSAYCRINKEYYEEGPKGECPWCGGSKGD